ncbi:MAG: primosome assembly protein PriA [Candidatus Nanopelagicales bacterium]
MLVDSRLPHLARAFTYSVPARLATTAVPGVRVRVRLAGRLTEGYVIGPGSDHAGTLTPIESVVSPVPVLTPDVLGLSRLVAEHYAGSVSDVVRLAVPPRVAGVESAWTGPTSPSLPDPREWPAGESFLRAAVAGRPARATWGAPAGTSWADDLAAAAATVAAAGRGVVIVVPDGRDVARVAAAVAPATGPTLALLTADMGPQDRYTAFLRVLSGEARVVVGTRGAAFAPVADPGLLVIWDDGDDSLAERRAPYPHAREVLALRSHQQDCALLAAGFARTAEVERWVEAGWMKEIADVRRVRESRPAAFSTADRVRSPFDQARRLPQSAVAALRTGLESGPVLVQVARRGYVPVTACRECREIAECPRCAGPLEVLPDGVVRCRRCATDTVFRCPRCGHDRLRAVRSGVGRTAEELGRLFPGVPVLASTGDHAVTGVDDRAAVVVATPGVEPVAAGGYAAGALLDAQEDLWRVGLRSREEALRRWFAAAALLRPGAPLAVCAEPDDSAVQALIRWDPGGSARAELARRTAAGLPPARPLAQVDGDQNDIEDLLAGLPPDVHVLGPRPLTDRDVRVLVGSDDFPDLRDRLHRQVIARAARHTGRPLRVRIDPVALD